MLHPYCGYIGYLFIVGALFGFAGGTLGTGMNPKRKFQIKFEAIKGFVVCS